MTPNFEVIAGIIIIFFGSYGLVSAAKDAYTLLKRRKGGVVPNMRNIPPAPIQRYRTPTPTIETQYGSDLLKVSTEIFIKNLDAKMHPEDRAQCSVLSAVNLLSEVGEVCHKKDMEKADKTRELFKQAAKP